jgi:predicted nucleic acid-binding protein
MKKIVIDTTVIVKWLNQNSELNVEQADKVLGDVYAGKISLFAPELAKDEIGKILLFGKKLSQTESKTPLGLLFDLPIQFVPQSLELTRESYAIAQAYGLSYNESVFLALAEQKGAVYLTEKIEDKAKAAGTEIISLKDY